MIQIDFPAGSKYLELRGAFSFREQIKALVDVPGEKSSGDVRFDAARKIWLVNAWLWFWLWWELGEHIAPVPADLLLRLPVNPPILASKKAKKKRTQQETLAAKAKEREAVRVHGANAMRMLAEMGKR